MFDTVNIVHEFIKKLNQELPQGVWFCCLDCHRINSALQKLVVRGEQELPEALLNAIQKNKEESETGVKLDVKWRVLNGKMASDDETKLLLSKAKTIFHVSRNRLPGNLYCSFYCIRLLEW